MKIRMITKDGGMKKYIDLDKKVIRERNEETLEILDFNFDGIVESFGSIERYIRFNQRAFGYIVID